MLKAYKIKTKARSQNSYSIYVAESAGKAKTKVVQSMSDVYDGVDYSWITSCCRAPEFDAMAEKKRECVAWVDENERWQKDRGHWFGGSEPSPVTPPNHV